MLTFKEILAKSGPDRIKAAMKSRIQRLTESMPPVVTEMLEQRRLLSISAVMDGTTLEITGSANAETISVSLNTGDNSLYVYDGASNVAGPFSGTNVTLIKILAGSGNDQVYINRSVNNGVSE